MFPISIYCVAPTQTIVDSTGYPVQETKYPGTPITCDTLLLITLFAEEEGVNAFNGLRSSR